MTINEPSVVADVTAAFEAYEKALCSNDIETLRELFWSSPLTVRYGASERLYGADAIHAFRAGRPARARPRRLIRTLVSTFGCDTATTHAEFRLAGDRRLGRQSQTWLKLPEGWRIVAAHVSYEEPCEIK